MDKLSTLTNSNTHFLALVSEITTKQVISKIMDPTKDCEVCETCIKIKNLLIIRDRAIKALNDSTIVHTLQLNPEYDQPNRSNSNESIIQQPVNLTKSVHDNKLKEDSPK